MLWDHGDLGFAFWHLRQHFEALNLEFKIFEFSPSKNVALKLFNVVSREKPTDEFTATSEVLP